MAEKEERIGIKIEIYDPCGRCTIKDKCAKNKDQQAFLIDPHSCFQYKLLHRLPTKADVIERMAKAICREDNCLDSCEECILGFGSTAEEKEQFCQKQIIMSRDLSASYVSRAEAALNALLEDK